MGYSGAKLEVGVLCWACAAFCQDLSKTRWCLLHHRGWQHRAKPCPCKLKAGHLVPFVQLLREIKSNPWSTVESSAEKLTPITPALDPFRAIYKHWLTNPPWVAGGRSRNFSPLLSHLHFVQIWCETGSCTCFHQVTVARSGPGCVGAMGWGNMAKQDTGEDHNLGSGERFISSTPHCSSFYKQSEMSWCQMLSWCKSAEYHRFIPAGALAPVPQWEGDGGKGETLFLLTAPPTFLLGKYLHMLTNAN